jgi:hypothetical protein
METSVQVDRSENRWQHRHCTLWRHQCRWMDLRTGGSTVTVYFCDNARAHMVNWDCALWTITLTFGTGYYLLTFHLTIWHITGTILFIYYTINSLLQITLHSIYQNLYTKKIYNSGFKELYPHFDHTDHHYYNIHLCITHFREPMKVVHSHNHLDKCSQVSHLNLIQRFPI